MDSATATLTPGDGTTAIKEKSWAQLISINVTEKFCSPEWRKLPVCTRVGQKTALRYSRHQFKLTTIDDDVL